MSRRRGSIGPEPRLAVVTGSRSTIGLDAHVVRQQAAPVDFDSVGRHERLQLVRGLLHALHAGPIGTGLAAPMTGVSMRVVVTTASDEPLAMFNPRVVATAGPEHEAIEGNLSLPGLRAPVVRPQQATIEWQMPGSGRLRTETFDGWAARVLLHEIEILDGTLFIDHAKSVPSGRWRSEADMTARAIASIFEEEPPGTPTTEALGIAILPPSLHSLDGVLTRSAAPVEVADLGRGGLVSMLRSMYRVLYGLRGVGLAAPQVGLGLRLVVIDSGEDPPLALINPEIVDRDEREELGMEGCLSIPGWRGEVTRSVAVKVRTDTVEGDRIERDLTGYLARIAQHEIDHLDGVLYTQRMSPESSLVVNDPDVIADQILVEFERQEAQHARTLDGNRSGGKKRSKKRR